MKQFEDILEKSEKEIEGMFDLSKEKAYVVFILDKSGSMSMMKQPIIELFNKQRDTIIKEAEGIHTEMCLWTFNTSVDLTIPLGEAKEIPPLTDETYYPNSSTALYDAIGDAIDHMNKNTDTNDERNSYLFVIITDGQENASKRYDVKAIGDLIEKLQDTKRWTFSYLGANHDVTQAARDMKINIYNTQTYDYSGAGIGAAAAFTSSSSAMYMAERKAGKRAVENFYNKVQTTAGTKEEDETKC